MNNKEMYLQDGGLRARTTLKDEHSKQSLKHQLRLEVETLTRQLTEEKGKLDGSLYQTYKAMIQARLDLLKTLA